MKRITTLILIFQSLITFGQINTSDFYIEYHKKCRLAEQYFLNDDTIKCFETYNQVFKEYKILFPRDCFTAAQIAHKLKKDSLSVEYILDGMEFGLRPEFFAIDSSKTNAFNLISLTRSKYWTKIIKNKDSLTNIYNNTVDWELKNNLMKLVRIDQDWRKKNNKWFNRNFRKGLEKKYMVINNQHIIYLDSIFRNLGYPGSWVTGIGDSLNDETNYGSFRNSNLNELPYIILYHNDSVYPKYGGFLFKELERGHIHPRTYAMISDFHERHLVKKDKHQNMYYNIWWEKENYTKEEFEFHCFEIGCPTKQHLRNLNKKLGNGYDIFWSPFR